MSDSDGWSLPTIEARIDELYRSKNEMILRLNNDPKVIGKKILHIESLIRLNEEVKDFLLQREPAKLH